MKTIEHLIEEAFREGYEIGQNHYSTLSSDHPNDRRFHEYCNVEHAWKNSDSKRDFDVPTPM